MLLLKATATAAQLHRCQQVYMPVLFHTTNMLFKDYHNVTTAPFNKPLPIELHGLFASHLAHDDLKSYSLVSRSLNRETNRVLWRSVQVSPRKLFDNHGVIKEFAQALMRGPVRAACIRRINLASGVENYAGIFPSQPTEELWNTLKEAFRLLIRLNSIRLTTHNGNLAYTHSAYPEQFFDIISSAFAASPIVAFAASLPPRRLLQLCQSWPTLVTLRSVAISTATSVSLPPEALPRLRHAELDLGAMRHIIRGRPLETLYQFLPFWEFDDYYDSSDFEWIAESIRCCKTLLRARPYGVSEGVEHSATLLPMLVHDNLRELEFHVIFRDEFPGLNPYDQSAGWDLTHDLIMRALPPGLLTHFPKLETLQIILYAHHFDDATEDIDNDYIGYVANTLADLLTSEAEPALNRVEIHCRSNPFRNNSNLSFLATLCEKHWEVKFSQYVSLIYTHIDDAC